MQKVMNTVYFKVLKRLENYKYVSVDYGNEKGFEEESTMVEV